MIVDAADVIITSLFIEGLTLYGVVIIYSLRMRNVAALQVKIVVEGSNLTRNLLRLKTENI